MPVLIAMILVLFTVALLVLAVKITKQCEEGVLFRPGHAGSCEVFASPHSPAVDRAENRLHAVKAVTVAALVG